ncbi:MAG: amidase [Phycisphaerales bacterium]
MHRRTVLAGAALAGIRVPGAAASIGSTDVVQDPGPTEGDTGQTDPFAAPLTAEDVTAAARTIELPLDASEIEALVPDLERRRTQTRRRRARRHPNERAPAETWRPIAGTPQPTHSLQPLAIAPGPLPDDHAAIAHASVGRLGAWIRSGALTSRQLTDLYLERIERLNPKLEAVITVTVELARAQADAADRELASGTDRGPLHGIPYGAKDLFDTANIRTTWGAAPYRERVPDSDAAVITRLREAGAVLVAKTTLGALAYGDIWFGGRTNNPWDVDRGSSGSSAGSASGTAAGLFAFSLGTETYGSIVSPSMECGTTGLRPTFGRVPRTGAMALCWSLDKVGPICRTVEDCGLVLAAIDGADAGDASSVDLDFILETNTGAKDLTVGFDPRWFNGRRARATDRAALEAMHATAALGNGPRLVEIVGPDQDGADELLVILETEAAAAFQELTLENRDDELAWQAPQAWPQTFRGAHFHSAVDLMQAMRMRRAISERMDEAFGNVDVILAPSFAGGLNLMTNFTGHPCLVLRSGFAESGRPSGVSLFGRLGEDAALVRLGVQLERTLAVAGRTPPSFS